MKKLRSAILFVTLFSIFPLVNNKLKSAEILDVIKENKENLLSLDYYKSKGFSLKLSSDKEINFNWGYSGHGNDIFTPFKPVKAILKKKENKENQNDEEFSIKKLSKIVLKNKLKKYLKENWNNNKEAFSYISWIMKPELNPLDIFLVKLILLLKSSKNGFFQLREKVETLALLLKLSQSNLEGFVDKNKPLSTYLPEKVLEILNDLGAKNTLNFIDDLWIGLNNNFNNYDLNKESSCDLQVLGTNTKGFVFESKDLAENCFNFAKNQINVTKDTQIYNYKDFNDNIREAVEQFTINENVFNKYEFISFEKFKSLQGLGYNFVGVEDFGNINTNTKTSTANTEYLPEEMKSTILESKDILEMISINDNEHWILHKDTDFGLPQALKMFFISLVKGFNEYKEIKGKDTINKEAIVKTETEEKDSFSEKETLEKLESLGKQKLNLENEFKKVILNLKEAKQNIEKFSSEDSFLYKRLLEKEKENFSELEKQQIVYEKEIREISKEIKILKGYKFLHLEPEIDNDSFDYENKNFVEAVSVMFLQNPFVVLMIDDMKNNPKYEDLKERLFQTWKKIIEENKHLRENIESYEYLLISIFPELKEFFSNLKKEQINTKETDPIDWIISII